MAAVLPTVPPRHFLRRRSAQGHSRTWSATHVRVMQHSHDWTLNCLSQCDQRYLETTVTIEDAEQQVENMEGRPSLMFRVRLHPQGNKESNKDFCFFQVSCFLSFLSFLEYTIVYKLFFRFSPSLMSINTKLNSSSTTAKAMKSQLRSTRELNNLMGTLNTSEETFFSVTWLLTTKFI